MRTGPRASGRGVVSSSLLVAGLALVAVACCYNEWSVALFDPEPPLLDTTRVGVRSSALVFLALGLTLVAASRVAARSSRIAAWSKQPLAARLVIAGLVTLLPLLVAELAARPFIEHKTTIFVPDPELGWKLRPGADDQWLGVRVRINDRGLRGPRIESAKPSGVTRILYLGDSVTFGALLASHEATYPFQVERVLEGRDRGEIETINAGVGGYSPTQEHRYLVGEGLSYDPDLVVVGFVLNDVLEEGFLYASGGRMAGFHLSRTAQGLLDRLANRSGLVYAASFVGRRLRSGGVLDAPAPHAPTLSLRSLTLDTAPAEAEGAWETTLKNLDQLFRTCRERGIAAVLVVIPFRFQLDDGVGRSGPQERLERFARERGIPHVDLLSGFLDAAEEHAESSRDYFLDETHLSVRGHLRAAEAIAASVSEGLP